MGEEVIAVRLKRIHEELEEEGVLFDEDTAFLFNLIDKLYILDAAVWRFSAEKPSLDNLAKVFKASKEIPRDGEWPDAR